ncbi:putative peptidyl-prolyl cis-trans isomerase pin4 [Podospora fimiseda]|uniref:Peptidyl-prolyl cis-trans isomerase n=1 Tax=Podospora fimiseda TaxID=252190 RepID=A0AAN7BWB1_9PEZI|nr:putative peptidyl-prolyl cis-trans isomerase pin4 [Podospora fimiseda]
MAKKQSGGDSSKKGGDPKGGGKGGKGGKSGGDSKDSKAAPVKGAQSIKVRHILCTKEGDRVKALERINAGESFSVVAMAMSEDKAKKGGDLGWMMKQSLEPAFAKVAFELPASKPDKPSIGLAQTGHGYHIIMVEERK